MPVIIDTSNLNGFCKEIARVPGVGVTAWNVMLYEVGKILKECVRLTTRDAAWKIKRSIEFKNRTLLPLGGTHKRNVPTIYITKSGIIWFADAPGAGNEGIAGYKKKGLKNQRGMVQGKTFHPMNEHFRYGQPRWLRYQLFLADLKNKQIDVRQAIGRAGQSWVQMANSAGIRLEGIPGYITNAPQFKGNSKVHGFARQSKGLWLEMTNQATVMLGTIDGNRILQTAINGRYKYFLDGMKRGVFDDVKQIAARYKGLIAA